jgi:hypothetical protein
VHPRDKNTDVLSTAYATSSVVLALVETILNALTIHCGGRNAELNNQ